MWLCIVQLIAGILVLLSLIWAVAAYHYFAPLWFKLKKVPTFPLIGTAWKLHDRDRIVVTLNKLFQHLGKITTITAGYMFGIALRDRDFIEYVASSPKFIRKSYIYHRALKDWLQDGLLLSDANKWQMRRKLLTPAYHFKILERFIENFEDNADVLVSQLQKEVGKTSFDVQPYIKYCSLDIICETAMGTTVNAQLNADSEYVRAVHTLQRTSVDRVLNPINHVDFLYKLSSSYRRRKRALEVVHGFRSNIVNQRRNALQSHQGEEHLITNNNKDNADFGIKQRVAFLDLLLQTEHDGKPLDDQAINEEVDTFMFEGHDTVSAALSFAIYAISNHPEVQDRLMDEQRSIFVEDFNRKMTYNDLQSMKYLEMVIKETLRLYPSVPYIFRDVPEDFQYKDLLIKKGIQICIFIYGLHHDSDYYPDPEKFDPERFSVENQNARHPFSFLGFSAGSRNCIGQRFAMLEMKAVLSKLLRSFCILPTYPKHEVDIGSDLILTSRNGIRIALKLH